MRDPVPQSSTGSTGSRSDSGERQADFFTTEVWTSRGLVTYFTVFVIDLASRRVQILGSSPHPEALFMHQIVRTVIQMTHRVRRHARLGGLLNFYHRAA